MLQEMLPFIIVEFGVFFNRQNVVVHFRREIEMTQVVAFNVLPLNVFRRFTSVVPCAIWVFTIQAVMLFYAVFETVVVKESFGVCNHASFGT